MTMNTTESQSQMAATDLTITENPPVIDSDSDDGILSSYSLPTISELTKSTENQQSLLTRSQYALVVFHGVADTYPTDSDIVCRYSLTDGVEAAPGDRIVLFAVGWSSIKDYVVFEWAPIPEKDERDLTVVFKAADLPKDVNEFYQVCYVSNESAVCGASVPFQVRTPHNEELTFAIEEDMVVVRSSMAVAQDKLLKAHLDRESLNKMKVNLEKQLRALEDKHSLTLRRLDRLQETLSTSNTLNEELKKENACLLDINEEMFGMRKELVEARIELDDAENAKKRLEQHVESLTTLREEYSLRIINFEAYAKNLKENSNVLEVNVKDSNDRLIAATEQIETLITEKEKFQNDIVIAHGKLQQSENTRADLMKTNFSLENELAVCIFNLNNAQSENLRLEAELKAAAKDNDELNEQLKMVKESAEMNENLYMQYSSNYNNKGRLIMENTRLQRSIEDVQLKMSILEHDKFALEQILVDTLDMQKKNACTDECDLEKRVAQLQYRLNEALNKKKAVENKQSGSCNDESFSSENNYETLTKLLDDTLKENELHVQENMALRIQIEFLETSISRQRLNPVESVNSSSFESFDDIRHIDTAQNQSQRIIHSAVNSPANLLTPNAVIQRLQQRLIAQQKLIDEYNIPSTDRDEQIHNMASEMEALQSEFLKVKGELKTEIANLVSKNNTLVEQEIQSQESRNEMQRITFMNQELLIENASLMKRIHDDKGRLSTNTDTNMLQKIGSSQNFDTIIEIENQQLRKELESIREKLTKTENEMESIRVECQEYKDKYEASDKELCREMELNKCLENRYSIQQDMLMQRMIQSITKADGNRHHECSTEPKLKQISLSVDHLLSAVEKLATISSEVKKDQKVTPLDPNDLTHRLELARGEYEKLLAVMINYRTKYTGLKRKYYIKKAEKSHHFST